jgi:hypothetical protein
MRRRVDGESQLGLPGTAVGRRGPGASVEAGVGGLIARRVAVLVVRARVPGVEPCGIDGDGAAAPEEAALGGAGEDGALGSLEESPFFPTSPSGRRSRCAA